MSRIRSVVTASLALAVAVLSSSVASAQPASIRVNNTPSLVECDNQACFRLLMNALDAKGEPVPVDEASSFSVVETGKEAQQWWIYPLIEKLKSTTGGSSTSTIPRYALLVVDTSGSMLEPDAGGGGTKFQAARAAIEANFIANFQNGTDRMAIVPFDSRRVRSRIDSVDFVDTKAAAEAQLSAIAPSLQGNTALYSAAEFAIDKLTALVNSGKAKGATVQLVIFTDGKNDVNVTKGDDQGLYDGDNGLDLVEKKTADAGRQFKESQVLSFEVITIGLGKAGQTYNPVALRRLADPGDDAHTFNAENQAQLEKLFRVVRIAQLNRVFLTFGPVRPTKDQLTSPVSFTITMRAPGGNAIETITPAYEPPSLGPPTWQGQLTSNEYAAFLRRTTSGPEPPPPPTPPVLMRLLVFSVFALVLALLWFGLPRLIWPERYVPRPSFQVAAAPAGRAARPPAGRPGPAKSVTIAGRAVTPQRPGPGGPPTATPSRLRDAGGAEPPPQGPPPPRPRGAPPAPPQRPAREPYVRGSGDNTVFVPPNQNRGGGDN